MQAAYVPTHMSQASAKNRVILSRVILSAVLICLLMAPILLMGYGPTEPSTYYDEPSGSGFAGKVLLMVPGKSEPNKSIERANYIGADGVIVGFDRWWDNVELYKEFLPQYRNAGLLISGKWGHHCEGPRYCTRFNPPIHDWALANQHKQMAIYPLTISRLARASKMLGLCAPFSR